MCDFGDLTIWGQPVLHVTFSAEKTKISLQTPISLKFCHETNSFQQLMRYFLKSKSSISITEVLELAYKWRGKTKTGGANNWDFKEKSLF